MVLVVFYNVHTCHGGKPPGRLDETGRRVWLSRARLELSLTLNVRSNLECSYPSSSSAADSLWGKILKDSSLTKQQDHPLILHSTLSRYVSIVMMKPSIQWRRPKLSSLLLLGLFCAAVFNTIHALEIGDDVCVQGYVMDDFCIRLTWLLDRGRNAKTLEVPHEHSVHCLVDETECVNSAFEVLADLQPGETMYQRAYRLDSDTKKRVVALARNLGTDCSTCGFGGTIRRGFRIAMQATVVALASGDVPPLVTANGDIVYCPVSEDFCAAAGRNGTSVCVVAGTPSTTSSSGVSGSRFLRAQLGLIISAVGFLVTCR